MLVILSFMLPLSVIPWRMRTWGELGSNAVLKISTHGRLKIS